MLLAFSPSLIGIEHQIESFEGENITLDDGSVWKLNERFNNAKHYNGTLANDPRTLQPGSVVDVIKWRSSATFWQVFNQYDEEIPLTEDIFIFATANNRISYLNLLHPPEDSVIKAIDFDQQEMTVGEKTYRLQAPSNVLKKKSHLWKVGDPDYIASDSEILSKEPLIVNSINYAFLRTRVETVE